MAIKILGKKKKEKIFFFWILQMNISYLPLHRFVILQPSAADQQIMKSHAHCEYTEYTAEYGTGPFKEKKKAVLKWSYKKGLKRVYNKVKVKLIESSGSILTEVARLSAASGADRTNQTLVHRSPSSPFLEDISLQRLTLSQSPNGNLCSGDHSLLHIWGKRTAM